MENLYPVYDFQVNLHSIFCQNAWFLDPVYKKAWKVFEFETLNQKENNFVSKDWNWSNLFSFSA